MLNDNDDKITTYIWLDDSCIYTRDEKNDIREAYD